MKDTLAPESYPLSALQQGMLFHSLSSPDSGVDMEQILCTLREPLRISVFEHAWSQVIERHPVLRTRFQWQDVGEPIQVVEPSVGLPLHYYDWRLKSPDE